MYFVWSVIDNICSRRGLYTWELTVEELAALLGGCSVRLSTGELVYLVDPENPEDWESPDTSDPDKYYCAY